MNKKQTFALQQTFFTLTKKTLDPFIKNIQILYLTIFRNKHFSDIMETMFQVKAIGFFFSKN